jgi:UDP-N-acetylglucosamine--N-acetylmuramyl-(pentapeptide) pyrophosphoryl-undecaprenol N-acetylglucosamine transferase
VQARRLLSRFKPDVVAGTGGYVSAPVILAQKLRKGKILIHEQNAIPGKANLWMSKWADQVCVTFEGTQRLFPVAQVEVTGMPIREAFAHLPGKAAAREHLNLRSDDFTVLVLGGSQGARKLNSLMTQAWPMLDDGSTQVLHQVGQKNLETVPVPTDAQGNQSTSYRIEGYIDAPPAMAAADIAVCRAGASTLAELAAAGLPAILVPYPYAYADHQTLNARHFVDRGTALLMPEDTTTIESLAEAIVELRGHPDKRDNMCNAARALARPDAARRVAELVTELGS